MNTPAEPLIEQLLYARELFYYSSWYHKKKMAIVVSGFKQLLAVVDDLTVIQEAGIPILVLAPYQKGLERRIHTLNSLGYPLDYFPLLQQKTGTTDALTQVISLPHKSESLEYLRAALQVASEEKIEKVIILGKEKGLFIKGVFVPRPDLDVLPTLAETDLSIRQECLEEYRRHVAAKKGEIVLVQAKPGQVFQEIFTHRGSGTLLAHEDLDEIRPAEPKDVRNIFFLLHPYLRNEVMRPTTPREILRDIKSFFVYTINEQMIASLRIIPYGNAYEIAKLSALPRYQNRGRPAKLVEHALNVIRDQGAEYAFALTTQESIGAFFERQGFRVLPREELPHEWKKDYDFSRASKAYCHAFA